MGRSNLLPVIRPTSSQVATICYTSVCGQHSYFVTSCLMHALREPPDSRKVFNILVRQLPDILNLITGVVITHGSLAQAAYAYLCQFTMGTETVMMSFLPLAHIYEVCPRALSFSD